MYYIGFPPMFALQLLTEILTHSRLVALLWNRGFLLNALENRLNGIEKFWAVCFGYLKNRKPNRLLFFYTFSIELCWMYCVSWHRV